MVRSVADHKSLFIELVWVSSSVPSPPSKIHTPFVVERKGSKIRAIVQGGPVMAEVECEAVVVVSRGVVSFCGKIYSVVWMKWLPLDHELWAVLGALFSNKDFDSFA